MMKLQQTGFSIIEVLISIFVLALGVIGAAGMQLTALRTSQQSAFQTAALELAAEMADRMRANDSQMRRADNHYLNVDFRSGENTDPVPPSTMCYSAGTDCSAEELAKFDIYEWERRIKAVLPGGRALICRDASPWDSGAGALTWACTGASSGSASLVVKLGWQGKNPDGTLVADAGKQFPPSVALTVEPYTR